jgi:transketolase
MVGIAAGLALSGKIVFVYSIANFVTLRCLEQIRNDACYHDANVKIVGVGAGLVYGAQGMTHHATEDMAIMRALPRMTVVSPSDPIEAELATRAIIRHPGTCYLRLTKAGEKVIHKTPPYFEIGKAIPFRTGKDVTIVCIGSATQRAIQAAERLEEKGTDPTVLIMHTLKPLDVDAVTKAATQTGAIITLEEHSITGGLGSAVAEILVESNLSHIRFRRLGLQDSYCATVGNQGYLCDTLGLSIDDIVEAAQGLVR